MRLEDYVNERFGRFGRPAGQRVWRMRSERPVVGLLALVVTLVLVALLLVLLLPIIVVGGLLGMAWVSGRRLMRGMGGGSGRVPEGRGEGRRNVRVIRRERVRE